MTGHILKGHMLKRWDIPELPLLSIVRALDADQTHFSPIFPWSLLAIVAMSIDKLVGLGRVRLHIYDRVELGHGQMRAFMHAVN